MGLALGKIKIKRFADGEIYVQLQESVRGCDVYLVQPTCPPANENLMELLIMIDACRRASAKNITAVIPYFGYARADRKGRESIAAKLVANLITEAGANRVLACDLHSGQSMGYFDIPVDHVYGQGISTYLGAAPIVECLERYQPDVVITSRVADAALFLAPMVFELGWNWDDLKQLAQGSLAGHLLECGCQLTGGYFMHPGDKFRDFSFPQLLNLSLPYAEISFDGNVCVAKAEGSGGVLNDSTCAEQLLYEVGDPSAYVTPDVIIDIQDVTFHPLGSSKVLCAGAKPSTASVPKKLLQLRWQ